MAENKTRITAEYIRSLTPEQWQEFRSKTWQKKIDMYSQPVPAWYMQEREKYITIIERYAKQRTHRAEQSAQGHSASTNSGSLTKKVELLVDDTDFDAFPESRNH